jgi:hypothetical protein
MTDAALLSRCGLRPPRPISAPSRAPGGSDLLRRSRAKWVRFKSALTTNLIEGINNKIKVIKRMAYGFRDDAYFFLKIRAAFPGVG